MLAFDGNTAPYLQYAHARICSIFRRAGVERESVRGARSRSALTAGACAGQATARLSDGARRDDRHVLAAQAVHLPVRSGAGLHGLLRALPGDQRRGAASAPAGSRCATSPRECSTTDSACSASTPRSRCDGGRASRLPRDCCPTRRGRRRRLAARSAAARSATSPRSSARRCSSTTSSTCAPAAARRLPRSAPARRSTPRRRSCAGRWRASRTTKACGSTSPPRASCTSRSPPACRHRRA